MLNANQTITVIHYERGATDTYTCRVVQGASWYSRRRANADGTAGGLNAARVYRVRIPAPAAPDLACAAGDKLCLGALQRVTGAEFAALARTRQAFTVLDVHPNLNGALPHYFIEGA